MGVLAPGSVHARPSAQPPILLFLNEKFLEFSDLARKLNGKLYPPPPPSDMCAEKFPLVSMGGRAEGLACTDPGARTPIGASGIFCVCMSISRPVFHSTNSFNSFQRQCPNSWHLSFSHSIYPPPSTSFPMHLSLSSFPTSLIPLP